MDDFNTLLALLSVVIPSLLGVVCYYTAKGQGRNPKVWGALGFFFGIFAIIALLILPKKENKLSNPLKEPCAKDLKIHNESAASIEDNENFDFPRQKRLSANRTLDWYYIDPSVGNAIKGPYKIKEFREEIQKNKLDCNGYIWCEEFDQWSLISDFSNANLILDPDFIE